MVDNKITCMMASFGHAKYVRQAVEAILNQTVPVSMIIVPVEGDNETLRELEFVRDNDRVTIIKSRYASMTHQKNLGFYNAKTDWAFLADSDDVFLPDAVEQYVKCAESTNAVLVYPQWFRVDENCENPELSWKIPKKFDLKRLHKRCYITDCSFVYMPVMRQFLPIRAQDGLAFIWNIWKKIGAQYPDRMKRLDKPIFLYRQHGNQIGKKRAACTRPVVPYLVAMGPHRHKPTYPVASLDDLTRFFMEVPYVTDVDWLLDNIERLRFRKLLFHWLPQNMKSIRRLSEASIESITIGCRSIIHVCESGDYSDELAIFEPKLLTNDRNLEWWCSNDIYD